MAPPVHYRYQPSFTAGHSHHCQSQPPAHTSTHVLVEIELSRGGHLRAQSYCPRAKYFSRVPHASAIGAAVNAALAAARLMMMMASAPVFGVGQAAAAAGGLRQAGAPATQSLRACTAYGALPSSFRRPTLSAGCPLSQDTCRSFAGWHSSERSCAPTRTAGCARTQT